MFPELLAFRKVTIKAILRCQAAWLFVAVGLFVNGCSRPGTTDTGLPETDDRIAITAMPVERSRITATLETVGTLLPVRSTTIVSEVDGVIRTLAESDRLIEYEEDGQQKTVRLGLDIGTWVDEGDVLMELDPRDFKLALDQAQAQLNLVRKRLEDLLSWRRKEEVQQLEARVDEAEAASELAQADLRRNERLLATGATTPGDHDDAEAAARRARAALSQTEAELAIAKAGPTAEQIAVAQAELASAEVEVRRRERELEKATIRSPYPAVITDRYVGVGDRVTAMPRVEIMKIVDPRMLFVEIDVPERYLAIVKLDGLAEVRSAGRPDPVRGKVELINGRIDPETRTFRVRIGIDNRQGLFKPGGFVQTRLPIRSTDQALVVPRTSIVFAEGQPAVYVYHKEGYVERRLVRLGIANAKTCEITNGLTEGEMIAVTRTALLADGLPVRLESPVSSSDAASNHDEGNQVGWAKSSRPTAIHRPSEYARIGRPAKSNDASGDRIDERNPVGREDLAHPTKIHAPRTQPVLDDDSKLSQAGQAEEQAR